MRLGGFHNKEGYVGPEDLAKTIEYVKQLVGAEHTCWGSDHITPQVYVEALDFVLRNPESYPPELGYGSPTEIANPGDIWGVVPVLENGIDKLTNFVPAKWGFDASEYRK